jgi:putative spermidine/putrescine transport system substrate-binding protein/spermidine/putrescine transport system substrate-binding protein
MQEKEVGTYVSQTHGYGNTVDAASGLDYGDRLTYLEAPEDFTRRTELWNEVKAAPI